MRTQKIGLLLRLLVLLNMAAATIAIAGPLDWSIRYRTLRSEHFEIVFPENQKALAKRYILAAEQAHELLLPIFQEAPYKTIIFMQDNTDGANALATVLPYPLIVVNPVLPTVLDSIDDYGDWALEMMVHEYTHILNLHPAHGIYVPLKWMFGNVVRPNALLPNWYLEGLAVNLESTLTDHGRLRSLETLAAARALELSGGWNKENIATINETELEIWPYGGRPYLYGGWWWENIHRQFGTKPITEWNQSFSRRLPFLLNGPMREQTQKSASQLWRMTAEATSDRADEQIAILKKSPLPTTTALASELGEQSIFAVSPSGDKLVYWLGQVGKGTRAKIKIRNSENPQQSFAEIKSQKMFKASGTVRVRWLDNESFVFDQFDTYRPYYNFRDLYTYNVTTYEMKRLTNKQRAQEPSPQPNGTLIAFIRNDSGQTQLQLLDRSTGKIKTLLSGNASQRLSTPEFLNQNEILFVARQRSGQERLHVYDLRTNKSSVWQTSLTSTQSPRVTAAGVFFTDAATNVRNVYRVQNSRTEAVSHTLTGVQTADYDPIRKELLLSEITTEGSRLRSTPLSPQNPPVVPPVQWSPPPKPNTTEVALKEESFQPIEYLWPRYWIPYLYPLDWQNYYFQGLTEISDPAARNTWGLLASYDTLSDKPSYGVNYSNSSLPSDIFMSYSNAYSYLEASELVIHDQWASLALTQYWPFNTRTTQWSLGGTWNETEASNDYRRLGPKASVHYSRLSGPHVDRVGVQADLAHQEYLPGDGYMAYGRTYGILATKIYGPGDHSIFFMGRGALAPNLPFGNVVDIGDRTVGANYLVNLSNSDFLMRGYPSGTFVGRKILNANLEYIIPLADMDRGWGTFPLFLRRLEGALFLDGVAVDGAGFDAERERYVRSHLSEAYLGTGVEFRFNSTAAYHMPLAFIVGFYYGLNDRISGGFSTFTGLGLGEFGGVHKKSP